MIPLPLAGRQVIDVTSVAELCRRWFPKLWRTAPRKRREHTAMADIRESLNELRFYREIMFREATLSTSYKHQLGR